MLFKNATIYTMEQDPFVGDFKVDKGVFTQVGKDLTPDVGEDVQDLNSLYVFPGLVESHCHLGSCDVFELVNFDNMACFNRERCYKAGASSFRSQS